MPAVEVPPTSFEEQKMESLRKRVRDHHLALCLQTKERFQEVLAELFFLQNGGNMMDLISWKRKPPAVYYEYVKTQPLELADEKSLTSHPSCTSESLTTKAPASTTQNSTSMVPKSTTLPSKSLNASPPVVRSPAAPHTGRPPSSVMTQEQIVEKAKQEAYVMQRIAELQRDGLWTEKRLPKVAEPSRAKSHWDYLLEEMAWLAADFAQERKWKKASAKKVGRMVIKHFQEKATAAAKAEKEEEQRLRKIASFIAKEIRTFWSEAVKVIEYKQNIRLEEKRKKVLDQHLNFIVNETEKYSSMMSEGLKPATETNEGNGPKTGKTLSRESDSEFEPEVMSSDDEETIALEETLDTADASQRLSKENDEVEALKRESEIPLEDLLDELPQEYLDSIGKSETDVGADKEELVSDDEFEIKSNDDEEDDEETIDQAEKEENESREKELEELEAEKDMPLEMLLAKYNGSPEEEEMNHDDNAEEENVDEEDKGDDTEGLTGESDSEMEFEEEVKDLLEVKEEPMEALGIKSLLDDSTAGQDGTNSKLSDAAALAESFQPKGNTLESTKVVAKVPFLLKHSLREYQHIGLDWMAAMYERKLNGILADEMGLGKTIQTIGLLAWLACEKGIWGPHLVVVPTSVMLNWEMEFKKWCPSFKILTYYGTQKDRRQKRTGWTKPNAFHVCITSYKLVIQDHQAFRRKRWRYFILDEAQNIKNFKSQRWQLLLNFQSQRRLLLTGTPLQNNLMELWSLMHFLMPDIFGSHRDFREWFSNPVTGMIEGDAEFNESIIKRLHKVLRPFILRRLKSDVEKQMPKKFEHVVMCRLSKRQRYLYEDFMSRARTKETLASGNLLSVMNVLMQLRKVCNHPNLFEPRPIASPFQMEPIVYHTASLVYGLLDYNPFENVNLYTNNLLLSELEFSLTAFAAHRIRRFQAKPQLIEEIDSTPPPPPLCPRGKIRLHVRTSSSQKQSTIGRGIPLLRAPSSAGAVCRPGASQVPAVEGGVACTQQPRLAAPAPSLLSTASAAAATSGAVTRPPVKLQLIHQSGALHAVSVPVGQANTTSETSSPKTSTAQTANNFRSNQTDSAPNAGLTNATPRLPLHAHNATSGENSKMNSLSVGSHQAAIPNANATNSLNGPDHPKNECKRLKKWNFDRSLFKNSPLNEKKRLERRERLAFLANLNKKRCEACPIYGSDLIEAVRMISRPSSPDLDSTGDSNELRWNRGSESYVHCLNAVEPMVGRRIFETLWSETSGLRNLVHTPEQYIHELRDIIDRFVVCAPAVTAPRIVFHTSHPAPSKLWSVQKTEFLLQTKLSPHTTSLHPIQSAMMTQFPDPRLIQYDCGKLQTLDKLLRQLKDEKHRVLIFTQMTRMLDVLEAFLNYHGHIYLRLDGATRIEQRQVLMERFNADRRIFCFILSTRSGGVGVNLTGADTVIFYDSDWNPTMDAQAQDRCHRIGQTRDVHIYRLISERTVEENILKKANQKRMLGDIAIEGGNFNPTFKKQTIHDLFEVDADEADASKRMAEVLDRTKDDSRSADEAAGAEESTAAVHSVSKQALGVLESALAAAEDETDVAAARVVRAEVAAEMAEFDESAPINAADDDVDAEGGRTEAEHELKLRQLESSLTPIQRYALKFMENSEACWSAEQLKAAEAQIEEQKKQWELRRVAALTSNDDERNGGDSLCGESDGLLTYSHQDSVNQVKKKSSRCRTRSHLSQQQQQQLAESQPLDTIVNCNQRTERRMKTQEADPADGLVTPNRKRTRSNAMREGSVTPEVSLDIESSDSPVLQNSSSAHSPRTRSRGSVNINLWTLDSKPLLPGTKTSPNGPKTNGCDSEKVPIKKVKIKAGAATAADLETESDLDVVS